MAIKLIAALLSLCLLPALAATTEVRDSATSEQRKLAESRMQQPSDVRQMLGLYAQAKETCFLKSEKTDGMNKTCFYNCLSGEAAITIKSTSLCPLNIQR